MAQTLKEERLRWVRPLDQGEISWDEIIKICPYSKRSLERWLAAYRAGGEDALEPRSTRPKTNPKDTSIELKEKVIALRKKTKLCALKLHWRLEKEGVHIHERTIGKILKDEGLVRTYRTKKTTYKYLRAVRKPGEVIEIDVKHVPGHIAGKRYFQYTAIDTATRWRHLAIYPEEATSRSIDFLKEVITRFPHRVTGIKTDNHSTFTNYYVGTNKRSDMTVKTLHALDRFCAENGIVHYLIDPGHPSQNGTVERSHREDQEKFYDRNTFRSISELKRKMIVWNKEYNDLEHCGLGGKTPNEAVAFMN